MASNVSSAEPVGASDRFRHVAAALAGHGVAVLFKPVDGLTWR